MKETTNSSFAIHTSKSSAQTVVPAAGYGGHGSSNYIYVGDRSEYPATLGYLESYMDVALYNSDCSGITYGGVLNGELYAQRLQKLI